MPKDDQPDKIVVREHTRSTPQMRGFDKVTIKETRTTTYEKRLKK